MQKLTNDYHVQIQLIAQGYSYYTTSQTQKCLQDEWTTTFKEKMGVVNVASWEYSRFKLDNILDAQQLRSLEACKQTKF